MPVTSDSASAGDTGFARAFERGDIAARDFHHVDHLRLAWVYLTEEPTVDDAAARIATALRRFAAAAGAPDKYSDTVTRYWVVELAACRQASGARDFQALLAACPHLLDKNYRGRPRA